MRRGRAMLLWVAWISTRFPRRPRMLALYPGLLYYKQPSAVLEEFPPLVHEVSDGNQENCDIFCIRSFPFAWDWQTQSARGIDRHLQSEPRTVASMYIS